MTKGKVLWEHIVSTSDLYAVLRVSARKFDNFSYSNIRLFFEYHKINECVSISLNYLKNEQHIFVRLISFFFVEFAFLFFPGNIGKLLQFNYLEGNLWDTSSFFIYSQVSNTIVSLSEVLRHPY